MIESEWLSEEEQKQLEDARIDNTDARVEVKPKMMTEEEYEMHKI